jgi:hypothetical protein
MEKFFENKVTALRFTEIYFFPLALILAVGTNIIGAKHVI